MYTILITNPAQDDIQNSYEWWRDNRSPEQAACWYRNIMPAIQTLKEFPERCPVAAESDVLPVGIRELHFGIGRRPTHRILFTIDTQTVIILRVRHSAEQNLTPEDLA